MIHHSVDNIRWKSNCIDTCSNKRMNLLSILKRCSENLRIQSMSLKHLHKVKNLTNTVAVVAHAINVRSQVICAIHGRQKRLVRRINCRCQNTEALGLELFNCFVSVAGNRNLHIGILGTKAAYIASLFQHLLIVSWNNLHEELLLRQQVLHELLNYLFGLLTTSSDDCRIGGNSINSQKLIKLLNCLKVSCV